MIANNHRKKNHLRLGNREFSCSWLILVLYVLVFCILVALGIWQLQRADEKKQLMQRQAMRGDQQIVELNGQHSWQLNLLEYKPVVVKGQYDKAHQILVDNQIKQGQVGYLVLTPYFIAEQNQAVLVNRGWLPMNLDRTIKPDVEFDRRVPQIKGRVNHFPVVGLKLAGADEPSEGWPVVVQLINTEKISAILGYPLLDFLIELDPSEPEGYLRSWEVPYTVSPDKHIAYAVQWFAMALALTGLFFWHGFRRS